MKLYLEDLRRLLEEEQALKAKHDQIVLEKKAAIEKVKEEYKGLLIKSQEEVFEKKQAINKFIDDMLATTSFPASMIGPILADLVTIVEGEKYVYQETTFKTKKVVNTIMDRVEVEVVEQGRILVRASEKQSDYEFFVQHLQRLCQDGDAIILDSVSASDEFAENIQFKTYDLHHQECYDAIRYGRFDYLGQYMNMVIADRVENEIENMNPDDFNRVSQKFYRLNKERILQNYENQKIAQEAIYQQELGEKEKKLQKLL